MKVRGRLLGAALVLAAVGAVAGVAGAEPTDEAVSFDASRAVTHGNGHAALTRPSAAPSGAVVRGYLRGAGRSDATVATLRETTAGRSAATGLVHARFEQAVGGLTIAGAYARAALTDRGELVHLIDCLVDVKGAVAPATSTEESALGSALARLHPGVATPRAVGRSGNVTTFARDAFFHAAPTVERVAIAMTSGALHEGFRVTTWSRQGNLLNVTLVSGSARVLDVELRTASESYNVFEVDPGASSQASFSGPGGWLSGGAQTTVDIQGPNAHAYLDTDANGTPDPGGAAVTDGNFTTAWNGAVDPTTASNQAVSVQNLFYLNNVMHDHLETHGFTNAEGNFEGDDPVNAEAQDGSGTDNANFSTPPDGTSPRMQMYLWTGLGTHEVAQGSATYLAQGAAFGLQLDETGITGTLSEVNDGRGVTTDACTRLPRNSVAGMIAVVDRGSCDFVAKAKNVQTGGAIAMLVVNNVAGAIFTMGGSGSIGIPAVMVSQADGATIRANLATPATLRLRAPQPLMRDSALDSDVVYHEYCHGQSWRMIGGMSGTMSGAVGEGNSDVCALLMNPGNDRVGEYSASHPLGIRSEPYGSYSRTYGDFSGSGVHFDGEIYAAIGWRLRQNYVGASVSADALWDDVIGGAALTPSGPRFEDMREGMLAAAPAGRDCLVWDAFADYGVGLGASATVRGSRVRVTESFALPTDCTAIP